jgi:alkaline phosphatase D
LPTITPACRRIARHSFLDRSAAIGGALIALAGLGRRAVANAERMAMASGSAPPVAAHGIRSGDMLAEPAVARSRFGRPAQMIVEWSTEESLAHAQRVFGPTALEDGDFTAWLDLRGLPRDQPIFYRVMFQDLLDPRVVSEPVIGHFRTAPMRHADPWASITLSWRKPSP